MHLPEGHSHMCICKHPRLSHDSQQPLPKQGLPSANSLAQVTFIFSRSPKGSGISSSHRPSSRMAS